MLYFSTMDQILKADPTELGLLIQKEMLWLTGQGEEPIIEDPRCDALHSRIKEQILLRERKREEKNRNKNKNVNDNIQEFAVPRPEEFAEVPTPIEDDYTSIEQAFKEKEKYRLNDVVVLLSKGKNEDANKLFDEALAEFGIEDEEVMEKLGKMVTVAASKYAQAKANNV